MVLHQNVVKLQRNNTMQSTVVTLVMMYALQKALEQTGKQKYVGSLQVNLDLTGGKRCGAAY